ncbi:hypothetical protein [Streptomyces sp. NPDC091259]|uniref:hypothetical protein n=1 Tax=Streptomyces sp. NPDC091259 TaxID=3365976 RepID=UPI003829CA98
MLCCPCSPSATPPCTRCAGVAGILLALHIEDIDPAHTVAYFGLIAGVPAVFATVSDPIVGAR